MRLLRRVFSNSSWRCWTVMSRESSCTAVYMHFPISGGSSEYGRCRQVGCSRMLSMGMDMSVGPSGDGPSASRMSTVRSDRRPRTCRRPHVCSRRVAPTVRLRAVGLTYAYSASHPSSAYVPSASRMPTARGTHRLPTCRRPHVCLQCVAIIVNVRQRSPPVWKLMLLPSEKALPAPRDTAYTRTRDTCVSCYVH